MLLGYIIYQILMLFFCIFSVGIITTIFNKSIYKLAGRRTPTICYITAVIGIPIHEIGHAMFCFIFRHQIEEIKLYQTNSDTLGYVTHTYNPKSIYQKIGNFFIGIGPLILGMILFIVFMRILLPTKFFEIQGTLSNVDSTDIISGGVNSILSAIKIFFSVNSLTSISWWIFVILMCTIGLHMKLSKADIEGSKAGVLFFIGFIFVLNIILLILNTNFVISFTRGIEIITIFILTFLCLMILCFCLIIIIFYLLKKIFSLFQRN